MSIEDSSNHPQEHTHQPHPNDQSSSSTDSFNSKENEYGSSDDFDYAVYT
jgi:hypothetical protein